MLNQVFNVSAETYKQFVADAVKISNIFQFFEFHRVVYQHIAGEVQIFVTLLFLTNQLVK